MLNVCKYLPTLLFCAPALIIAMASGAQAGSYPHYLQNGIDCNSCHNVHGSQPKLLWEREVQQDIDYTTSNQLCWSCHNDSDAPAVLTHSSLQTGNTYGNWTVECVVCHDPHFHLQAYKYPNDYLSQGVVDTIEATTLKKTGPADWTPDAYRDTLLFPNKNQLYTSYRIISNNEDTLTVDPDISTPQADGSMDLSQVSSGDTFVIRCGRLIRDQIDLGRIEEYLSTTLPLPTPDYPKSGFKQVKFIRPTGINSFADGDATTDGICEVCHTQTTHWRNDGTLAGTGLHEGLSGGNCIICHKHTDGFAPFDHLAEGAVVPAAACTVCHETVRPVSDVHGNNCGLCHLTADGGGPLVEPYESNTPAGGDCSDCHNQVTGSHDEISHAATPGQDRVLIFSEGDHDDAMVGDGEVLVDCARCHTLDVKAAHAQLCKNCHLSPVDSLGTWNGSCQQGGCHVSYHNESNVAHFPFDNNDDCTLCHNSGDWLVPQTNCSNCHANPDNGPPVTSSNVRTTYNGAALIDFTVDIGDKVGVGFTFYRLDGEEIKTGSGLLVTDQGDHTLEFWTVDQSGRVETPHNTANFTVIEDTTAPVTTSNAQADYWQYASITLNATDASDQGVKTTYYKLDGGSMLTYTSPIYVPGIFGTVNHTLEFWSDDWSGNVETPHNTVSFSITAGTATIRLVWGDSDTTGSPCPGDPEAYVDWEIHRDSTLVSQGGSDCPWSGVNDIVVPVYSTPYYVDIFWWDSWQGFEEITEYPNVNVTTPGEIIILRY